MQKIKIKPGWRKAVGRPGYERIPPRVTRSQRKRIEETFQAQIVAVVADGLTFPHPADNKEVHDAKS